MIRYPGAMDLKTTSAESTASSAQSLRSLRIISKRSAMRRSSSGPPAESERPLVASSLSSVVVRRRNARRGTEVMRIHTRAMKLRTAKMGVFACTRAALVGMACFNFSSLAFLSLGKYDEPSSGPSSCSSSLSSLSSSINCSSLSWLSFSSMLCSSSTLWGPSCGSSSPLEASPSAFSEVTRFSLNVLMTCLPTLIGKASLLSDDSRHPFVDGMRTKSSSSSTLCFFFFMI